VDPVSVRERGGRFLSSGREWVSRDVEVYGGSQAQRLRGAARWRACMRCGAVWLNKYKRRERSRGFPLDFGVLCKRLL
jgi:hypothetical protein